MTDKQLLGQFYTTNAKDILEEYIDFIPKNELVIDPFAGNWDILNLFIDRNKIRGYDIDPQNKKTLKRDTLLNPPRYKNSWIATNPPYLARNRASDKSLFEKYNLNDLYKIALKTICEGDANGGILIIPTNFLFGKEHEDIRCIFFEKYLVKKATVYEHRVFDDTTSTVCVFFFEKKTNLNHHDFEMEITFVPSLKRFTYTFEKDFNYSISRAVIEKNFNQNKITRRVMVNDENSIYSTNILVNCLDTASNLENIGAKYGEIYIGTKDDRVKFSPYFEGVHLNIDSQKKLVNLFNYKIKELRNEYNSAFLSSYREGTRKRLDFNTAYRILEACLYEIEGEVL